MRKNVQHKGFTLVEVIVAMGIVSIVMVAMTLFLARVLQVNHFTIEKGMASFAASRGVDRLVTGARDAQQAENGAFAVVAAKDDEFIFHGDYDHDGTVERVRYTYEHGRIVVGLTEPTHTAGVAVYNLQEETEHVLVDHVVNGAILGNNLICNKYSTATQTVDGSATHPFTHLWQARQVASAGVYHFNLGTGGGQFEAFVDLNGWVQIAIDFGNGVGELPIKSTLKSTSRGILAPAHLASLVDATEARISHSGGQLDATTGDSLVLARIRGNTAIRRDKTDNHIRGWNGLGASSLNGWATCANRSHIRLSETIVHICGDKQSVTWVPANSYQRYRWENGEIATNEKMQLWVRAAVPSSADLTATRQGDGRYQGSDGNIYTEAALRSQGAYCIDSNSHQLVSNEPVFEYFATDSAVYTYEADSQEALATPAKPADVRMVKVLLHINPDPAKAPDYTTIQSFVTLRNISEYLIMPTP